MVWFVRGQLYRKCRGFVHKKKQAHPNIHECQIMFTSNKVTTMYSIIKPLLNADDVQLYMCFLY
jgi:hypothetical protein